MFELVKISERSGARSSRDKGQSLNRYSTAMSTTGALDENMDEATDGPSATQNEPFLPLMDQTEDGTAQDHEAHTSESDEDTSSTNSTTSAESIFRDPSPEVAANETTPTQNNFRRADMVTPIQNVFGRGFDFHSPLTDGQEQPGPARISFKEAMWPLSNIWAEKLGSKHEGGQGGSDGKRPASAVQDDGDGDNVRVDWSITLYLLKLGQGKRRKLTITIPPSKKARASKSRKAREKRLEDLNVELARSIKASESLASQLAKAREQQRQGSRCLKN